MVNEGPALPGLQHLLGFCGQVWGNPKHRRCRTMSTRIPQPARADRLPLRLVHAPRPPRATWASCLPLGEILVMVAFGLVLVVA
jgi:hypothetical protein